MTDSPPSLAWSGPCDVIVRRHPKGGYLVDIIGSGTHATLAHGLYTVATPPLTLAQAGRLVHAMREVNLQVDDKVLQVDARLRQWGNVLLAMIVGGAVVGLLLGEGHDDLWRLLSTALLLLVGVALGGWFRDQWERDPLRIPSPFLPVTALVVSAVPFGLMAYFRGVRSVQTSTSGWVLFAAIVAVYGLIFAAALFYRAARRRRARASTP
jgi:hypothetical protein